MVMRSNPETPIFEGWRSLYHVKSDRMINIKVIPAGENGFLYVDQECNFYPHEDFYHWKSTE